MAFSIGERIVQAFVTTLDFNDPGKPTGLTVHRDDSEPLERDDLPALVAYPNTDPLGLGDHQSDEHSLEILVEARVRKTDPLHVIDQLLDELYVWAVQRVHVDRSFGGLAKNVRLTRRGWDREAADSQHGLLLMGFTVEYFTALGDPTTEG